MNIKIKNTIEVLNTRIFDNKVENSIGLADGKMGQCIYFYYISRLYKSKEYLQKAELLISEIFEQVAKMKIYDMKTGLASIGLGVDYLVENEYIEGNINEILEDVDDILFKQICNPVKSVNNDISLQIQLIYYFTVRLRKQNKNNKNEYLFREVIIDAINFISEKIYLLFLEEPLSFDMENNSVLSLLTLSHCNELHKDKISRILKEISSCVLSKVPVLHANRLYLLYAMDRINKKIETKDWNEHIKLLIRETNIEYIVEKELADEIFFSNGLPAIYFLLSGLGDYFSPDQICGYKKLIINKIENSQVWYTLLNDEIYLKLKNGLFSGCTGTSLLLHKHYNDENRLN